MEKTRVFFDMDGTLAEWKSVSALEELYKPGYFERLKPQNNVVAAAKKLCKEHNDAVEVYVLSAALEDHPTAIAEKNRWLDRELPEIDCDHRVFTYCSEPKSEAVPCGIKATDILVDDYSLNLRDWAKKAVGIKVYNGVNGTKGTWKGKCTWAGARDWEIVRDILSLT